MRCLLTELRGIHHLVRAVRSLIRDLSTAEPWES